MIVFVVPWSRVDSLLKLVPPIFLWLQLLCKQAILTSIQSLLCDPNPASPANSEASRLYNENRREYNRRVREIVEQSWVDES